MIQKKILTGDEAERAMTFLVIASKEAIRSTCYRSKCGAILVSDNSIIGAGYNSPPLDAHIDNCIKDSLPTTFKSDKTCCIHAEQRAIMNAMLTQPNKIPGSRIYFIRLENGKMKHAGEPYCTICSKFALDAGVAEFVLWHEEGITVYGTKYYNELSFKF